MLADDTRRGCRMQLEAGREGYVPLANTYTFQHLLWEVSLDDAVDLCRAEADTAGILLCTMSVVTLDMRFNSIEQEATYQNAISATKEDDLACTRILLDEIAMAPHVVEAVPMSAHAHTTYRPQRDRRLFSEIHHG